MKYILFPHTGNDVNALMSEVGRKICILLFLVSLCSCATTARHVEPIEIIPTPEEWLQQSEGDIAAIGQYFDVISDPAIEGYVNRVVSKVTAPVAHANMKFTTFIVDSLEPFAFVFVNGDIYISTGFLLLINSEDELAAVIAHEIVHVVRGHKWQEMQRVAQLKELESQFASRYTTPQVNSMASSFGEVLLQGYNRDQEREADILATSILLAAGYDPYATVYNLDSLSKFEANFVENDTDLKNKTIAQAVFSSHPASAVRRDEVYEQLREDGLPEKPRKVDLEYLNMVEKIKFKDVNVEIMSHRFNSPQEIATYHEGYQNPENAMNLFMVYNNIDNVQKLSYPVTLKTFETRD